jgi:hypothetical protein
VGVLFLFEDSFTFFDVFGSVCVDFVDLLLKDVLQVFEIAIVIVDQHVQSLQLAVL